MIDFRQIHPPKPVLNPERIAVMMPTRGRPAMLVESLSSFLIATRHPDQLSFWIAVDDDDTATLDSIAKIDLKALPFAVNWVVLPRQPALALTWNLLWQAVSDGPGYYLGFIDDYVMLTQGWDEAVRDVLGQAPAGLGLGQIPDPIQANPDTLTVIVGTAAWFNRVGHFVPPYFPFWFMDTWHDHVATTANLKFRLPIEIVPQGDGMPGTQRMRELGFWYRVFCAFSDERMTAARQLAREAYGPDLSWYESREVLVREKTRQLERKVVEQPEAIQEMQDFFASKKPWSQYDEDRYAAMKTAVLAYLGEGFRA